MYLLKKVFQLRDKSNPDMEKPFLEHLEDLRMTITRVVVTLILATIGCFVLQDQLMEVLRKPAEDVWKTHVAGTLPEEINVDDWEAAKGALKRSLVLPAGERDAFLVQFDERVAHLARADAYLWAAQGLPEDRRDAYLAAATSGDPKLAETIRQLVDQGVDPDPNAEPNLKMMSALKPTETFMLSMKLAFFAGVVVSFPFLLFFTLQFVLPGLHNHERKILWPAMAVGFGLFLFGVLFAYFVVLPRALSFFFEWDQGLGVASDWRIGWYISFATQFTLLFGLSFELPVVIMALVKIGLLTFETMNRTRSYAILTIVVLAAMITPTGDILTLSLMAVPMYILYEICILLAWLDHRKARKQEEEEERERLQRLLDHPPAEEETEEEEDRGDDLSVDPHDPYDSHDPYDTSDPYGTGDEPPEDPADHDRAEDDRMDGPYDPGETDRPDR